MIKYLQPIVALIVLTIFSTIVSSCKKGVSEIESVYVDVTSNNHITDFVSGYDYTILETNDSCLVGSIGYVDISSKLITLQSSQEVLTFSRKGKFLGSFNHHGEGPDEYIEINGLRTLGDTIFILDQRGKKILEFKNTGELIHKIALNNYYVDFYPIDIKTIALASGNFNSCMHEFVWINERDGTIINELCKYGNQNTVQLWDYTPFAGIVNDRLIVNIPFFHTSYSLTKDDITPFTQYTFNSKEQLPNNITIENLNIATLSELTRNRPLVRQLGYYSTSDSCQYLTFRLFGNIGGIMDHIVQYGFNGQQIAETMIGAELFPEYPYLTSIRSLLKNGKMLSISSASTLLNIDEQISTDFWKSNGLTEDSNPVVFIYDLR